MSLSKQIAKLLLEVKAIKFSFDPPFTYTSGIKSPIYLDNRQIMSYPKVRSQIIEMYLNFIEENIGVETFDYISGTATAAIPMGAWLSDRLNKPMVYVRMNAKAHGMRNQIEGFLRPNSKVLVLEDHISTAKSLAENVKALRDASGVVEYAMATTSYEKPEALEKLEALKVQTFRLAKGEEITDYAYEMELLSLDQKQSVDQWFKDASKWQVANSN